MGAVFGFLAGIWNTLVSVGPILMHAACEIIDKSSQAVKLGGGS